MCGEELRKAVPMPDTPQSAHKHTADDPGQVVEFPGTPEHGPMQDNNLPLQLTGLVGRGQEIREVEGLLAENRLLTLTGPGGSGKTRLALAVAQGVVGHFEDGAWLVEPAPLSDPKLVAQTVASVLGVSEVPGRSLTETLVDYLLPRRTVLVLDNCEHLVGACASLADTLLRSCPNLKILATSREALGVEGEALFVVPPLSLPDPRRLPAADDHSSYEATGLFVERAREVKSGFEVTERNAVAIAQVCHRLDGMPLAIELAAARAKVLSVEQISECLDDRFALLTSVRRRGMAHHGTLRATMEWSHHLHGQNERILLRRLSVFAGASRSGRRRGYAPGRASDGRTCSTCSRA
jgi:predicted ATPase